MNCQNLTIKYQELLNLQAEFQQILSDFQKMKPSTMAQRDQVAKSLKDLQGKIQNLITTEFTKLPDFKFNETQKTLQEQYASIINIYKNNDLIDQNDAIKNPFPDLVEKGIAKSFPFPTERQIRAELRRSERKDFCELKIKQGFTRIQITPIIPLSQIIETLKSVTLKHEDNLFDAQKDKTAKKTKLTVNKNQPVWFQEDEYGNNADLNNDIIYYINKFPDRVDDGTGNTTTELYNQTKHGGLTKKELLLQSLKTPFPGYIVELKQENQLIPRKNKASTTHGRKNLETKKSPEDCLKEIQIKQEYQGESLTTIDSEIINAIISLEESNGVIRDFQNSNDAACFAAGTYLRHHDYVPSFYWIRDELQFSVGGASFSGPNSGASVASSARLG